MSRIRKFGAEEEGSYLISISDIMMGLLFIFIIILSYFAAFAQKTTNELSDSRGTRAQLLNVLKTTLQDQNVGIIVDEKNGILRLSEITISFKHGTVDFLDDSSQKNLETIAKALSDILPCYLQKDKPERCGKVSHSLEAVFIEGHTDTTGDDKFNWELSTQRGLKALWILTETQPNLNKFLNSLCVHANIIFRFCFFKAKNLRSNFM